MTRIDRDRIILAKIGWSENYDGVGGGDNPRGNFEGLKRGGPGNEAFNFKRAANDRNYGYFRANKGRLRLRRIHERSAGGSLGGVTVVWVSVPPKESGLRVVGWYRNATVFDSEKFGPWSDVGVRWKREPGGEVQIHLQRPGRRVGLPIRSRTRNVEATEDRHGQTGPH